jgi:hypothetical protein
MFGEIIKTNGIIRNNNLAINGISNNNGETNSNSNGETNSNSNGETNSSNGEYNKIIILANPKIRIKALKIHMFLKILINNRTKWEDKMLIIMVCGEI